MSNSKFDMTERNNFHRYNKKKFNDFEDDEYNFREDYKNTLQKKKMKKISNALRTKDIDKLMSYEEDEDFI